MTAVPDDELGRQADAMVKWLRENMHSAIPNWWVSRQRVARTGFLSGFLSAAAAFAISGPGAPVCCGWVLGGGYGSVARYRSQKERLAAFQKEVAAADDADLVKLVAELLAASPALRRQPMPQWLSSPANQRVLVDYLFEHVVAAGKR
eukprot:TRINITY_DN37452_c0_g1_i1.p1 TRINITY_DN37452_c0_g1~~TRINITY_DN37452_c0_g1_i1.p1  ORF type:complete len:148 (+),score=41.76 TRINITY_DN37452_c0_g1_i1:50-493(+)